MRKYIDYFNPDVTRLNDINQDFLNLLKSFDAGDDYKNFNSFLNEDSLEYISEGNGVTYIVWNVQKNSEGKEVSRDCVAYYTLSATSIPYEDRIRLEPEESITLGKVYDITICGVPALEIKMFAVNRKYQDLFYTYDGIELPISAWVLNNIIDYAETLIENCIGFKAVFLHSVPEAEEFYKQNGFQPLLKNMQPLHTLDSEYTPLYLSLRSVIINYDD